MRGRGTLTPEQAASVERYVGFPIGGAPPPPVAPPAAALGLQLPTGIAPMNAPAPPPVLVGSMDPPMRAPEVVIGGPAPAPPPPPVAPPPAPPAGAVVPPPPGPASPRPPAPAPARPPPEPSIADWTKQRRADEKAYLGTYKAEREALDEASRAAAVKQDEAAEATARMARLQEEQAANEAAFQRDAAEQRERYRAQTQAQLDEVREMKVDPGRLYRDAGAWQGIMVGIGGALAGLAAGFQGRGDNAFVDMINRNIDRDIAAQQQAIHQRTAGVEARNSIYGQMVASHRDEALAREQTRTAMLQSARTHLESEAMRLGTPEAMARAKAADAQLAREQAAAQQKVDAAEEQAAIRAAQARAAAAAAAAAAAERARDKRFQQGLELEKLRLEEKKIDKGESGGVMGPSARFVATGNDPRSGAPTGYLARDKESAEKHAKSYAEANKVIGLLDRIIARREQQGTAGRLLDREVLLGSVAGPGAASAAGRPKWKIENDVDKREYLLAKKNIDELGALSGSDIGLEDLGDVNAVDPMSDDTTHRLRTIRDTVMRSIAAQKGQTGATRVTKQVTPDGREVFTPLGGAEAPSNPKVVERFNADGTPKK